MHIHIKKLVDAAAIQAILIHFVLRLALSVTLPFYFFIAGATSFQKLEFPCEQSYCMSAQ